MQQSLLSFVAFLLTFTLLPAATTKLETLQVGRYTRQGSDTVLVETGFLRAPKIGFVMNSSASYPESLLGIPSETLTAINGKAVCFKPTIDLYNQTNPGFLDNYTFSTNYYSISGSDSYIVTLASGGGTSAPVVSVGVSKTSLKEGPGAKADFTLTLSKAPTEDIVVLFKFGGTANGSGDFLSSNNLGSVRINKGKKTGKVTITLVNDKVKESKEKVVFTLLAHGGYKLGSPKAATVTITDDD